MHARHGQGAAAAQARSPRSKLSDFFHLWVNNIRLLYWGLDDLAPQLPEGMGNLQSDSKKKQKKRETAAVPASTSTGELETVEDQRKDKRDQPPKTPDGYDEPREPIKISFEKVQTPGHTKRPAPQPPKIVLSQVAFFFSYVQVNGTIDWMRNLSGDITHNLRVRILKKLDTLTK